jgi:hypothetical protein
MLDGTENPSAFDLGFESKVCRVFDEAVDVERLAAGSFPDVQFFEGLVGHYFKLNTSNFKLFRSPI